MSAPILAGLGKLGKQVKKLDTDLGQLQTDFGQLRQADARKIVRNFVLGLNGSADSALLEDYLQDPVNLGGWNAVLTTKTDVEMIAELSGALEAATASPQIRNTIESVDTALEAIYFSDNGREVFYKSAFFGVAFYVNKLTAVLYAPFIDGGGKRFELMPVSPTTTTIDYVVSFHLGGGEFAVLYSVRFNSSSYALYFAKINPVSGIVFNVKVDDLSSLSGFYNPFIGTDGFLYVHYRHSNSNFLGARLSSLTGSRENFPAIAQSYGGMIMAQDGYLYRADGAIVERVDVTNKSVVASSTLTTSSGSYNTSPLATTIAYDGGNYIYIGVKNGDAGGVIKFDISSMNQVRLTANSENFKRGFSLLFLNSLGEIVALRPYDFGGEPTIYIFDAGDLFVKRYEAVYNILPPSTSISRTYSDGDYLCFMDISGLHKIDSKNLSHSVAPIAEFVNGYSTDSTQG